MYNSNNGEKALPQFNTNYSYTEMKVFALFANMNDKIIF